MNFLSITFRSIHANVEKISIKKRNKAEETNYAYFVKLKL